MARTKLRKFERTHPWITFSLDTRRLPPKLWLLLGECQSKCEHIARVPLQPDLAKQLHLVYLAKGVRATTAIEGNTLSEKQILDQMKGQLRLPVSQEYLAQETDNILKECNRILGSIRNRENQDLNRDRIKELNTCVLENLPFDSSVGFPGEIKQREVGVGRYLGAPAEDCKYLLERLCDWLNTGFQSDTENTIVMATLRAVLAHLYLAWIHPFGDGNGRTARLLEFQILLGSGVPAPAAHLLSNHYNQTRAEYYRQLDAASASGGDVIPFLNYAVQGFRDGLRLQLEGIHSQQLEIIWRNHVYEVLKDGKTKGDSRRRRLVLELSTQTEPVPVAKISAISAQLAAAYAGKTLRTLSRDVNVLVEKGLLVKEHDGVRAPKEIILSFLPTKAL